MLEPGRMNRKVIIERVTETRDGIGGVTETWATQATVWAQQIPVGGSEALKAGRETASQTSKFLCWYVSGITEKDRLNFDSKYWNIINIKEIGYREGLEITAEVFS